MSEPNGDQPTSDRRVRNIAPVVDTSVPSALDFMAVSHRDWMGNPVTNPLNNPAGQYVPPVQPTVPARPVNTSNFDIHWFQDWRTQAERAGFGSLYGPISDLSPDNTRGWLLGIAKADPLNPSIPTPAGSSLSGYLQQTPGALSWLTNYIKSTVGRHLA